MVAKTEVVQTMSTLIASTLFANLLFNGVVSSDLSGMLLHPSIRSGIGWSVIRTPIFVNWARAYDIWESEVQPGVRTIFLSPFTLNGRFLSKKGIRRGTIKLQIMPTGKVRALVYGKDPEQALFRGQISLLEVLERRPSGFVGQTHFQFIIFDPKGGSIAETHYYHNGFEYDNSFKSDIPVAHRTDLKY